MLFPLVNCRRWPGAEPRPLDSHLHAAWVGKVPGLADWLRLAGKVPGGRTTGNELYGRRPSRKYSP